MHTSAKIALELERRTGRRCQRVRVRMRGTRATMRFICGYYRAQAASKSSTVRYGIHRTTTGDSTQ